MNLDNDILEMAVSIATDQLESAVEDFMPGIDPIVLIRSFRKNQYIGLCEAAKYLREHNPDELREYADIVLERLNYAKRERLQQLVEFNLRITNQLQ